MLVSIADSGSIGSGCSWFLDFLLAFFPATLFDEHCADAFLFLVVFAVDGGGVASDSLTFV